MIKGIQIFLLTISLAMGLHGQELKQNIELKNSWLQLREEQWIPLHWKDSSKIKVAGLHIPEEANLNKDFLVLQNKGITDLYVNNNFFERISEEGRVIIGLNELRELAHSEDLFITVFAEKGKLSLSGSYLSRKAPPKQLTGNKLYQLIPRTFSSNKDQVLILFYILVLLFVIAKVSFFRVFNGFFNWSNMLRNIPPEENLLTSTLGKPSIYFLILMACIIGLELTIYELISGVESINVLLRFFYMSFIVIAVIILKYFFLKWFGALVGASGFYKRHYYEYLRIVFSIALLLLLPLLIIYLQGKDYPLILEVFFLIGCGIGVFRLLLIASRQVSFSFLYLFSYICTSEIVPILIVTKFLF